MNDTKPSTQPNKAGNIVRASIVRGTPTLRIEGRFDFRCHQEFRSAYESLGAMDSCEVDLEATDYLDSSALGMLLVLREAVMGGRVRILRCRPAVRRILEIANFQTLFSVG